MYRFLLAQAENTPSYRLHCRGTHSEHRTRWVRETNNDGRTHSRRESYTETVTDFDFYIDTSPHISVKPVHWSVADNEPAYRGLMVREVEMLGDKHKAGRADTKAYMNWAEERTARGLPPWFTNVDGRQEEMPENSPTLRSSKNLRQWADEYCASKKYLKEFVYDKVRLLQIIFQIPSSLFLPRCCMAGTSNSSRVPFVLQLLQPCITGVLRSKSKPAVPKFTSGQITSFQGCFPTSGLNFYRSSCLYSLSYGFSNAFIQGEVDAGRFVVELMP